MIVYHNSIPLKILNISVITNGLLRPIVSNKLIKKYAIYGCIEGRIFSPNSQGKSFAEIFPNLY